MAASAEAEEDFLEAGSAGVGEARFDPESPTQGNLVPTLALLVILLLPGVSSMI